MLLVTTTATTMATMARMTKVRMKQIHRFLRAARADTTAFSVYPRLVDGDQGELKLEQVGSARTLLLCPSQRRQQLFR
jgi:hypothetical protein